MIFWNIESWWLYTCERLQTCPPHMKNVTALPCEMQTSFIWSKYDLHYQTKRVDSTVTSVSCNNILSLLQIKTCYSP